ncbi:6348_t:CDS:2 [Acaulospora colombiana]|uniref:6348_t:CDS:1 n=1 Tax=Acaulospora colombiana TaxID=27376 RepID=A0ACA9K459_9GLOM|nr:6348_t:CDS:2 [Acaulospora colombiana]
MSKDSSIESNAASREFYKAKGHGGYESRIRFFSLERNENFCQAFDPITDETCFLRCQKKSNTTYSVCDKHDKPKFVAAIHAKEYFKSIPLHVYFDDKGKDKFLNNLANYFTERSLELERPIEEGMFYVIRRIFEIIQNSTKPALL